MKAGIENGRYGIYKWDHNLKSNVFHEKGNAVYLKEVKENVEDDTKRLVLEFDYNNQSKSLEIERGELVRSSAAKLLNHGIDALEGDLEILYKSIFRQEDDVQVVYEHEGLGWYRYQGVLLYRAYESFGSDNINFKSTYKGSLSIEPKGSYDEWKAMVKVEVLGNVPMEIALIFGLSSVLSGYLAQENNSESLLIHLFGESSSGKTTACELAISTSGAPTLSTNGLMNSWNNTDNYSMAILRDNKGMAVLFDEASMVNKKDFTNIIYTLVAGKEKGRMNKNLSLRDTSNWCTTLLSTGEHSLIAKSNRNTGLQVRCHEFGSTEWTTSAKNADAIKDCVRKNFGHAGLILAQYLINQSYDDIKADYYQCVEEYLDALTSKDEFSNRIAKKQAIILVTAKIAVKALELDFDIDGILAFLISSQDDVLENRDMGLKAYELILEQIKINQNKFYNTHGLARTQIDTELVTPKGDVWGEINTNTDKDIKTQEVTIIPGILENILSEGGFSEHLVVLRKLRDKGFLDCEKGKLKRRRKLRGSSHAIPVYVIKIKIEEKEKTPRQSLRKSTTIKSKISSKPHVAESEGLN